MQTNEKKKKEKKYEMITDCKQTLTSEFNGKMEIHLKRLSIFKILKIKIANRLLNKCFNNDLNS